MSFDLSGAIFEFIKVAFSWDIIRASIPILDSPTRAYRGCLSRESMCRQL